MLNLVLYVNQLQNMLLQHSLCMYLLCMLKWSYRRGRFNLWIWFYCKLFIIWRSCSESLHLWCIEKQTLKALVGLCTIVSQWSVHRSCSPSSSCECKNQKSIATNYFCSSHKQSGSNSAMRFTSNSFFAFLNQRGWPQTNTLPYTSSRTVRKDIKRSDAIIRSARLHWRKDFSPQTSL